MIQASTQAINNDIQQETLVAHVTTDNTWNNAAVVNLSASHKRNDTGDYIWTKDNPASPHCATFKAFTINTTSSLYSATLYFAVDDYGSIFINGMPVTVDDPNGNSNNYITGRYFNFDQADCEKYFVAGENVITILAYNYGGNGNAAGVTTNNAAGIYASLPVFAKA